MNRRIRSMLTFAGLAAVAAWLLLAAPATWLGIDTGQLGFAMLVLAAWGALYWLYRMPRTELERAIAPGEWRAWIGAVFMLQLIVYLLLKSDVFAATDALHSPGVRAVGRHVLMLFIAWVVISHVLKVRWRDTVQEDERDREIARMAESWGSLALIVCIIGIVAMLGLSPIEKLDWAKPLMIANVLVFALLWSALVQHACAAIGYWRERH